MRFWRNRSYSWCGNLRFCSRLRSSSIAYLYLCSVSQPTCLDSSSASIGTASFDNSCLSTCSSFLNVFITARKESFSRFCFFSFARNHISRLCIGLNLYLFNFQPLSCDWSHTAISWASLLPKRELSAVRFDSRSLSHSPCGLLSDDSAVQLCVCESVATLQCYFNGCSLFCLERWILDHVKL